MRKARRTGRGVRLEEWRVTPDESLSVVDGVLEWCRDIVADCRRPFGIDYFDLAIACRSEDAGDISSERFLRLRPLDLYAEGFTAKLREWLSQSQRPSSGLIIAAALFSWGEAAHQSLPAQS